jgi:hypothetical protein
MASNVDTLTTELRIRIPPFTVDFTPDVSPEISPISFVGEDGQMWQGEQENLGGQEQGCQEQESDDDYYGDYEDNCTGKNKGKGKGKGKGNRLRLRMLFRMKAPPSNLHNRDQKNGRASKMCSIS